uniref:Uncharacterized protein n=1 Tax=Siphoviridae sp. ctLqe90 TaxID=2825456 RepID=A0A8S5Q370_9CAUD|nr:MAG TPA: hypothetical protein [Siphoviridae sp. ctLqe90]
MNTYNKHTIFRTVHSIYEHNDNIVPCVVAFTPCNDMTMTPNLAEYELQDIFDTFDYLLKNQFDLFTKSAIYKGNSSPLNISELVSDVIEIMEKNYNFYRCSIKIVKPIEDVYLEELTGIRDINKKKEIKKVNIQFVDGMVTDCEHRSHDNVDKEKAKE